MPESNSIGFEILEHPADVGFRAWAASAPELFATAARALMAIAAGTSEVKSAEQLPITVQAHDFESLMVNWLEEILYLFDTGRFTAHDFAIDSVTPEQINGRVIGEPSRFPWKVIVKAITYHQIEVTERNGLWEARVFVDV